MTVDCLPLKSVKIMHWSSCICEVNWHMLFVRLHKWNLWGGKAHDSFQHCFLSKTGGQILRKCAAGSIWKMDCLQATEFPYPMMWRLRNWGPDSQRVTKSHQSSAIHDHSLSMCFVACGQKGSRTRKAFALSERALNGLLLLPSGALFEVRRWSCENSQKMCPEILGSLDHSKWACTWATHITHYYVIVA